MTGHKKCNTCDDGMDVCVNWGQGILEQLDIFQLELENSAISLSIKTQGDDLEYSPAQLMTATVGGYIIAATKLRRVLNGEQLYG